MLKDCEEINWISGEEELYQTLFHSKKIILKKKCNISIKRLNGAMLRKTIKAISEDK